MSPTNFCTIGRGTRRTRAAAGRPRQGPATRSGCRPLPGPILPPASAAPGIPQAEAADAALPCRQHPPPRQAAHQARCDGLGGACRWHRSVFKPFVASTSTATSGRGSSAASTSTGSATVSRQQSSQSKGVHRLPHGTDCSRAMLLLRS